MTLPTTSTPGTTTTPVLRTLSPALRTLERNVRARLDSANLWPMPSQDRTTLETLAGDLRRQSETLDIDRPLLVVMTMGGTGVGKSTLLNALAGGTIAAASFQRPTTRDPVVYYHESIRPDRLDPALRHCRLVAHDRPALQQKILVDTPDVDSNDLSNREKLLRLLPVADVVIYVGSQEKYHDKMIWELFLEQKRRRAFAFVLNKWDRCVGPVSHAAAGIRPDVNMLQALESVGFEKPLLFRTCAQVHVDRAMGIPPTEELPEDEQFPQLVHWLEMGLTRLEIEAIKARGVGQLLTHLEEALTSSAPPDLREKAANVRAAWSKPLNEDATATADVLVNTLEPYQREIEHHFALEGQRRFRGLMAWYLQTVTRAQYVGSNLRERIPFASLGKSKEQAPAAWSLALFTGATSDIAGSRQLDSRSKALSNRLLVEADGQGFPLSVLSEPVEALAKIDWRQRWARSLTEILDRVERQWTQPTGSRRVVQGTLVFAADWLPPIALLGSLGNLLWRILDPMNQKPDWGWIHLWMPLIVLLVVFLILHLLIHLLLPLRWNTIREEFHRQLEGHVRNEFDKVYLATPTDLAEKLLEERQRVEKLLAEVREVQGWLAKNEKESSVAGLYGEKTGE